MIYFVLVTITAFLVGFTAGIAIKTFLDRDELLDLEKQNARLHAQIEQMRRNKVGTIEIIDQTVGKSVDFSKNW